MICPLPTIQSRVFVVVNCWQWVNFTMETNEQNVDSAELRQKVSLYKHVVVLQRGLPSLDGKLVNSNVLSQKSGKSSCQTRVRQTIVQ